VIRIYNSLSRKREDFEPLNSKEVNIYTCGVTVYDECHIGHARSLYIFDVIRNYLEYRRFKVNFVRNITDIDDKIINRANELKVDWKELVAKYIESYKKDLSALSIREGIVDKDKEEPRATKSIPDMVEYIKALIEKGYAYEAEGDVYFDVRKFKDYGRLSGQNIEEMQEGVRIEPGEKKRDPLDFTLWKQSKENEPSWDSPWGKGRPGWHIECSVMSQKFLKTDTLDIHAGGRDLIFPHHENEIAQAQACTGRPFAKYWIHHGLLTINGQKMAKSLGNFITIKDVLKNIKAQNDVKSDILKDFFLGAHYSHPIDFSDKSIEESTDAIYSLLETLENSELNIKNPREDDREIDHCIKQFENAMNDDFNTPRARANIFGISRRCNYLRYGKQTEDIRHAVQYGCNSIHKLSAILGLSLPKLNAHDPNWGRRSVVNILKEVDIEDKIKQRKQLREEKKYNEADNIRKELEEKGIILKDSEDGTTSWRWKK